MKKQELTLEQWKNMGNKMKEIYYLIIEFSKLLRDSFPKTYYNNKFYSLLRGFGILRSHLDELVCRRFLDHPNREITSIFYGEYENKKKDS